MTMTKEDVRAEHILALARLDEDQVRAIKRISRAFREAHFTNTTIREVMELVFQKEAQERSVTAEG